MKGLDIAFDPSGIPHRFLFFDGRHEWPAPSICSRAVGWMEVMAMKAGLRPNDDALAGGVSGRELDEARAFEEAGRTFWAGDRLEAVQSLAEGLRDMPELVARIEGLKASKEYGQFLAAERKRDNRSAAFLAEFPRAFGAIEDREFGDGPAVGVVLGEMRIGSLKKEAKNAKVPEDRSLASRLLFEFSFAAQSRGGDLIDKGDLVRAGDYYDLAIAVCEEGQFRERYLYYNRACIAALSGQKNRALQFLAAAVDKGLTNVRLLETDKDLDSVRNTGKFREILEKARGRLRDTMPVSGFQWGADGPIND